VGLVYDPTGLPGVMTARPGVAGVLHQVNAFHLNSNRKFSNNLIGLNFMACIFSQP
jgi:hypothetical protein